MRVVETGIFRVDGDIWPGSEPTLGRGWGLDGEPASGASRFKPSTNGWLSKRAARGRRR